MEQEKIPAHVTPPKGLTEAWKILVVEDDLSLKPFWEFLIRKNWPLAQMDWALSGETAFELLRSSQRQPPYDMVIADVFLSGGLTGLDIAKHVANSNWKTQCEVVLCSASDRDQLTSLVEDIDMSVQVLNKPYASATCVELIKAGLDRLTQKKTRQKEGAHES